MGIQNLVLTLAVFASSGDVPESEPSQVAVMPLVAKRIPAETAEVLDEILLNSIHRYSQHRVIGASDINSILGLERMKDVVGCDDTQCAVEIGGALGVEYLVAGSVSRLGEDVFIILKLVDIRKTQVIGRGQASVRNDENLFSQAVNRAAQEVLRTGKPAAYSGGPRNSMTKEVIELDGPMFQRFLSEGIDKNAYLDYVSSKLSYPIWARKHNRETESVILEVSKWVSVGTLALIGGVMLTAKESEDDWGMVIIPILPMAITTTSLFAVDRVDIGNVPSELKHFN